MILIQRLLKTYKGAVFGIGMLLVSVVGVFYGVIPASGRIIELAERRQTIQQELQSLNAKLTTLAALDEGALRNSLLILLSGVPQDKSIPSIFSTVERAAVVSGVSVDTITIENPGSLATESAKKQSSEEKKLGSSILTITASMNGAPKQIHDFLDQIVRVRRFLLVRYAEMTFFSGSHATLRIGLDAFWSPLPASLGDTMSPLAQMTQSEEALVKTISAMPAFGGADVGPGGGSPLPSSRDPFSL